MSVLERLDCQSEANTEVVLTGERAGHIRSSHPEMEALLGVIRDTVLDPDEVHRNKKDTQMAVFYRALGDAHFLRVAVLMQPAAGRLAHSVITARKAYRTEVARGQVRLAWRRGEISPGGTTIPSWP